MSADWNPLDLKPLVQSERGYLIWDSVADNFFINSFENFEDGSWSWDFCWDRDRPQRFSWSYLPEPPK